MLLKAENDMCYNIFRFRTERIIANGRRSEEGILEAVRHG